MAKEFGWDSAKQNAEENIKDDDVRHRVIEAMDNLRAIFGSGFLDKMKRLKIDFIQNFAFAFFWNKGEIIALSEKLSSLRSLANYHDFISEVKNFPTAGKFYEFLTLIDTAFLFESAYKITFEPSIHGFNKKPDFLLLDAQNKEIYLEVSELRDSMECQELSAVLFELTYFLHGNNIQACGSIIGIRTKQMMAELLDSLKTEILSAVENDGIFHYSNSQYAELIFFSNHSAIKASECALAHAIDLNSISGPRYTKSEWSRFWDKISKKQLQLPLGAHNVVLIWANHAMIDAHYFNLEIEKDLDSLLNDYAHLAGVIVFSKHPSNSLPSAIIPGIHVGNDTFGTTYCWISKFRQNSSIKAGVLESLQFSLIEAVRY